MVRRAAKADDNQPEIVATFRSAGATVTHLHMVGMGCPDILVGWRGVNLLVEIKDGSKIPSKQKLNKMEKRWHDEWKGQVAIVNSSDAALNLLGLVQVRGVVL